MFWHSEVIINIYIYIYITAQNKDEKNINNHYALHMIYLRKKRRSNELIIKAILILLDAGPKLTYRIPFMLTEMSIKYNSGTMSPT